LPPHPLPRPGSCPASRPGWNTDSTDRERAEERLAQLARGIGALRRTLAAIADRLIASEAHAQLCYARLGDYARERAGLSARQLQELARVHRALSTLPALERALVANELPWSKVRLVARLATAEDEGAWITRARRVSTRRLAQEIRDHARAVEQVDPDADEPQTRVTVRCSPALREKWALVREMAQRVAGQRLRDGDALELVAAEVFSSVSIDPALAATIDDASPRCREAKSTGRYEAPAAGTRGPAPDLPQEILSLAAGLDDADAFELDRRLRRAVRLEQTLDAAMAPLLRRVASAGYEWSGDAYWPLGRYAEEHLGMPASKARALVRLERAGDVCPELRAAYRSGRLSWVKAQCLLPLLLLELEGAWRPAWVAWAQRVTVRRLERDVERALLLRAGSHFAWQRCKFHPERAQDPIPELEQPMCAHDVDLEATLQLEFRVPVAVAALYRAVRETVRTRLRAEANLRSEANRPLRDGEVFDALLDAVLFTWTRRDPGARRPDPVIERDGYECAIPGCTSRRSLHDHHVVFRSHGGGDAEANRLTLCAFHHQRCVHMRLMRVTGRAPDALVFELGLRQGAPPLARYRSGDVALGPHPV
jgi:hypothetical protein